MFGAGIVVVFFSLDEKQQREQKKTKCKKENQIKPNQKKVRCLLYAANYILQPPLIPTNHYLNNKSWKYFRKKRKKREAQRKKKCTKKWNEISRQSLSIIFIFFSSLHQWWKRLCSLFFLLLLLSPNKYMFWANLLLL